MRLGAVDLSGARSPRDVYARLRQAHPPGSAPPPSGWVLGYGWDEHAWAPDEYLEPARLNEIFPKIPVCLHRVDRHAIICNEKALRRAGINDNTSVLVDQAMAPVLDAIPPADAAEDRQLFEDSARIFRRFGVSSAHMALTAVERVSMLQAMRQAQALPMRVFAMIDGTDPQLDELLSAGPIVDKWFSARTIKFFADGALGSGGARLLEPYQDGSRGLWMHDLDELSAQIQALMRRGWQIAVHAIGDAAAKAIVDIYAQSDPATRQKTRPRLEHAQMMTRRDRRRMKELSLIASVQPIHLRHDALWAHKMLNRAQLKRLFPWRELAENTVDSGLIPALPLLAAGSDYPIDDPNPWHGVATALSRSAADGQVLSKEQALTRREVLLAYTFGAAYAAHQEHQLGALHPTFCADMIALSDDPFEASIDEIWQMEVLDMWIGGRSID